MPETNAKYKKPYYGIKLDLAQVGVDIRLNDIPIYYDDQKGQLTVDLPASSSIIDGKNELKIIAFPPFLDNKNKERMDEFLPGSVVTIELYVQELDDSDNKKEILSTLAIKFNEEHLTEIISNNDDLSAIKYDTITKSITTRSIDIESPFVHWAWQDGQPIKDSEESYNSLLLAYKDIYDALSNKDKSTLLSLYNEKAKEAAIAYHLNGAEEGHKKISTGVDMNNNDLELYTFWKKNMVLDVYANGYLARIIGDTAPSIQPIIYLDRDARILHKHKFGFYKSNSGKWVLIR